MEKNIWLWWEQGWSTVHPICRYTLKSFEKTSPSWRINIVDKANVFDYISPKYSWIFDCEGPQFRSDLVRVLLLKNHGGVYSDAACLSMQNLDSLIEQVQFDDYFTFKLDEFYHVGRKSVSWFMISEKEGRVITSLCDAFLKAAKLAPIDHPYFLLHETYNGLIKQDSFIASQFKAMRSISGFKNRVDASLLHMKDGEYEKAIKTQIIHSRNQGLRKLYNCFPNSKNAYNFHPTNIKSMLDKGEFTHIKLRHKGLSDSFEDEGSLFNTIFNSIVSVR